MWKLRAMKSISFTVFSYSASTSHSTQPITCAGKCDPTQPNPTQPMDGPNPCPSLSSTKSSDVWCTTELWLQYGPAMWNSLPATLRDNSVSLHTFKWRLKTYFFVAAFLWLWRRYYTRSSAIAEGPRDASCQLKSCQLSRDSAETTCIRQVLDQVSAVAN